MSSDGPIRAVVTRPVEDAGEIARALAERGIEAVIEPMLEIVETPPLNPDLGAVQALLATSRNGVRALARNTARRDIPLFAVGDSTAALARELGFAPVETASGDVAALAALVADRLDPAAGPLFHAAGSVTVGDLAGRLGRRGFTVATVVLYESRPAERLSPALHALIAREGIDLVLFFSPRTARTFAMLAGREGVAMQLRRAVAVCLSQSVAREIATLAWHDVRVAALPDAASLLAEVDAAKQQLEAGQTLGRSDG